MQPVCGAQWSHMQPVAFATTGWTQWLHMQPVTYATTGRDAFLRQAMLYK